MENKNYKFTDDWFSHNIPTWDKLLDVHIKQNKRQINSVLEIGCYEGKASMYLADNWLKKGTKYQVVDTFQGSESESGMKRHIDKLKEDEDFIYKNFVNNVEQHPDIEWKVLRGVSQCALPILWAEGNTYDLIYIDASHKSDDTFVDAWFAHRMLNEGGIMIFDDFMWKDEANPNDLNHSPQFGIEAFIELNALYYNLLFQGYQIGLYRLSEAEILDKVEKMKEMELNQKWVPEQKPLQMPTTIKGTFG